MVKLNWNSGEPMFIQTHIKKCGEGLYQWGNEIWNRFKKKIQLCRAEINRLKSVRDFAAEERLKEVQAQFGVLPDQQEAYWK